MESNSAYPSRYHNDGWHVGKTKALSNNLLHYIAYKVAVLMSIEVGADTVSTEIEHFEQKAAELRNAIRSRFWLPKQGYYAYFEDEHGVLVTHMEALGEALVLLAPGFESDAARIDSMFDNIYRSERGIPCLWPRFRKDSQNGAVAEHYHNGRVWPFVQGYWALAAARHGKVDIFMDEMSKLVASSQIKSTFAEYYEMDGTFAVGHGRQLWSGAGFLGMVHQGLFGMSFHPHFIQFSPVKPRHPFANTISLKNVSYRDMMLDIFVTGWGSRVVSFQLDGVYQPAEKSQVPSHLTGSHVIKITLGLAADVVSRMTNNSGISQ
eukprot:gnl/TRDRNA2_/TRDRNA2_133618_c1_seq1.p1 gnl/TRDRNA2_/TRDRNA2_133618_c1~~gnl/TRDRNA2_/TRDRNA2_133618_c1_seq1.p1  ORF type:complete len:321 (-),score=28.68 gnl/TRDRNA2_/TRDRNA2_133618_c1_seq1:199-1161(-)